VTEYISVGRAQQQCARRKGSTKRVPTPTLARPLPGHRLSTCTASHFAFVIHCFSWHDLRRRGGGAGGYGVRPSGPSSK